MPNKRLDSNFGKFQFKQIKLIIKKIANSKWLVSECTDIHNYDCLSAYTLNHWLQRFSHEKLLLLFIVPFA